MIIGQNGNSQLLKWRRKNLCCKQRDRLQPRWGEEKKNEVTEQAVQCCQEPSMRIFVLKKELEKSESISHPVMSDSLQPHGLQPVRLLYSWNSPGKNTGLGCHSLLQGIFPIWGLNPGILHCRQILYCLSHQGSPQFILIGWKCQYPYVTPFYT